jgi:predicted nucleic acid-binding protein
MDVYLAEHYVVLPYTVEVARQWARLVSTVAGAGYIPGQNDAWIAASALA